MTLIVPEPQGSSHAKGSLSQRRDQYVQSGPSKMATQHYGIHSRRMECWEYEEEYEERKKFEGWDIDENTLMVGSRGWGGQVLN